MRDITESDGSFVTTTAGDRERERFSRRFNLAEGLLVMAFILVVLWGCAYPFGVMLEIPGVRPGSTLLLVAGALYLLFVSPRLHRDTLSSWGLGDPWALFGSLRTATPLRRAVLAGVVAALFVGLNVLNYRNWGEVSEFFNFDKLPLPPHFFETFPGSLMVVLFGSLLASVIVLFGIRYDNFGTAFATAMKIALPLLGLIMLAAYAQRGAAAFAHFSLRAFLIGAFGYVFWGFVQQLLFSSYFGTRLRKAFGPSSAPGNRRPAARVPEALKFAFAAALVLGPLAWLPIRLRFGGAAVPVSVLAGFVAAFGLFGGLYGWFYAVDRRRLLVATLTGSCFGVIHINSYGLVAVTFLLGIFLSYVFMEERNRNLVALGFIHGVLGSSFGMFFSKGQSGALKVDYGVGPWNVDDPSWGVLVVPALCVAGYLWVVWWFLRRDRVLEGGA